jgi:quercetin dioxygenase-like cupin family protein
VSRGLVVRLRESEPLELAPGVTMRPLFGEGAMLNLLEFEPGAEVGAHSHPHEQLGHVLDGELSLSIDRVEYRLGPGDAYQIPGDVEHSARSAGGCVVMDVFQPVREDYRERAGT